MLTGGFRLSLSAVNPAPETAAAAFAVSDTVVEALTPGTDLDEFIGTGTPGQRMNGYFKLDQVPVPDGHMITFEIIDPATGLSLTPGRMSLFGTDAYYSPGDFVVPAGGTFRVRAYGWGTDATVATAAYRFYFR